MKLNDFRRKISHLFGKTIIQFSPMRSGSTLVFNILREVFPHRHIQKRHKCESEAFKLPVVVTYRHPLDCIASLIQRHELSPTPEVLEQHMHEFDEWGGREVLKFLDKPNVLMLRYEEFVYDFEVIFRGVETFFEIEIPLETRNRITDRYQIEAVEKSIEDKSTFSDFDATTHWHGKHISKYKGKPFAYKEFFQEDQIQYLAGVYEHSLKEFGYE